MVDAARLLDTQLRSLGRSALTHGGSVTHIDAEAHAKEQYRQYDEQRRTQRAIDYAAEIAGLKATDRDLPIRRTRRSTKPAAL